MSHRVLLVDDDEAFAESLAAALRSRGHEVDVAATGAAALALAPREPQVVLVDIKLPDCSGFDLARQLRARVPGALIMGISGYARLPTPQEVDGCGIACMFLKPTNHEEIAYLIEGWHPPPRART